MLGGCLIGAVLGGCLIGAVLGGCLMNLRNWPTLVKSLLDECTKQYKVTMHGSSEVLQ